VRHTRPTPLDEVKGGLFVFEQTRWNALPRSLRARDATLRTHTAARSRLTPHRSASAPGSATIATETRTSPPPDRRRGSPPISIFATSMRSAPSCR
jgi:hypothetical protein